MSQVHLQVRPRRVRCKSACEPPPFHFAAVGPRSARSRGVRGGAMQVLSWALAAVGFVLDAALLIVGLTLWCAIHVTVWSYAFNVGPAANCFGGTCPAWVDEKLMLAGVVLASFTLALAILLRTLNHRATSTVLFVLLTFDIAALLLLLVS